MKNNFLTLTLLAAASLLFLTACHTKTTDSTIIGNWVFRSEYQFSGTPRGGAVCFVIENKAYMGLGYNGLNYPVDFFVLDLNGGNWRQVKDFPGKIIKKSTEPSGRERAVSFAAAGKGYVGLGYNRDDEEGLKNGAKDFYAYDPAANTWTKVADFPSTARYDAIAFSVNNKGYVGTGRDEKGYYRNDMYSYDPASNTWKVEENFPGGKKNRAFALSLPNSNVAYVAGGYNNGKFSNDFYKFDGATSKWVSLKPKTDAPYWSKYQAAVNRVDANMFSISGKIYITNGVGSSGSIVYTTYEWDPSITESEWVEKTSFDRSARQLAVSFTLGDRGFVCAGQNSSNYWDDTIEFLPTANQDTND